MRTAYNNELMHYGVLGMKWGIRRYQPYSEKPRASGKGGTEVGEAKKTSSRPGGLFEQNIKSGKNREISPVEAVANGASKALDSTQSIMRSVQKIKNSSTESSIQSKSKSMSDEELRTAINRMNLERTYNSLSSSDTASGMEYAMNVIEIAKDVAVTVSAMAAATGAIYGVVKTAKTLAS